MQTKTLLTIKTDRSLKEAAQNVAGELGFQLGTLVNAFLLQFVRDRNVAFSAPFTPNKKTATYLERVLKDADEGKNMSPIFTKADDAIKWLNAPDED